MFYACLWFECFARHSDSVNSSYRLADELKCALAMVLSAGSLSPLPRMCQLHRKSGLKEVLARLILLTMV